MPILDNINLFYHTRGQKKKMQAAKGNDNGSKKNSKNKSSDSNNNNNDKNVSGQNTTDKPVPSVFWQTFDFKSLEKNELDQLNKKAAVIQACWHRFIHVQVYQKLSRSSVVIQSFVRRMLAAKKVARMPKLLHEWKAASKETLYGEIAGKPVKLKMKPYFPIENEDVEAIDRCCLSPLPPVWLSSRTCFGEKEERKECKEEEGCF